MTDDGGGGDDDDDDGDGIEQCVQGVDDDVGSCAGDTDSGGRSFKGWTHWAISRSSQCSTTGVTKAVVCAILSVGWCI